MSNKPWQRTTGGNPVPVRRGHAQASSAPGATQDPVGYHLAKFWYWLGDASSGFGSAFGSRVQNAADALEAARAAYATRLADPAREDEFIRAELALAAARAKESWP